MGRKTREAETVSKQTGQNVTVDDQCPYCRGERKHSFSQRKACKKKGPIKAK